jgi:hypothetical protein
MEIFKDLQYQLLVEVIPTFALGVQTSKSLEDIKPATKKLLESLMEMVYPEDRMIIKPKFNDPQEVTAAAEESKTEELDFLGEVTRDCI